MAHSNENISEQNNFENSNNADAERVPSAFADRLQSYRAASEVFRQVVQSESTSDALQRAANLLGTNSATEALAKVSENLSGITDIIKKISVPQLASEMAFKASAEISQQQKAVFELQKSIIPSSATIAAAARLVTATERTQKMLEWMNNPSDIKNLVESLNKTPLMKDNSGVSKISALQSVSEHMLSAHKVIGTGLLGLMNNPSYLSSISTTTTPDEEVQ